MKRLISILLICVMLTALLPQVMAEQSIVYTLQNGVLTISGTGEIATGSLNVDKYSVERIVVREGITSIGEYALSGFYFATEIELPNSLQRIGEGAFWDCMQLEEIFIPVNVSEIGEFAFFYMDSLQAIRVAEDNAHFLGDDRGVLYTKDKSLLVFAPWSITGKYEILEGTKRVGYAAFAFCAGLHEVTIPDGLTHIDEGAFWACEELTRVHFGEGLLEIGESAFCWCYALEYVNFPKSLQKIGVEAFRGCGYLKGVELREGLQSIGPYAFAETELRGVRIPNSVTVLGEYVFLDCENLQRITLGSGVKEMETAVLLVGEAFQEILVNDANPYYESHDGVLLSEDMKTLLCYPSGRKGAYEVPEAVEHIAPYAFAGANISSVTVPDGVTSIGEGAFNSCYGLRSVVLGDGIRSLPACFSYCENLSSVTFGKNFEGFEADAEIWGCDALRSLYFMGDAPAYLCEMFAWPANVYFTEGTKGWTEPTWNDLLCMKWNPETLQFTDMPDGDYWSNEALQYAVKNGYMYGTSMTEISPEETASRAMFVTMLSRMESDYLWGYNYFEDVPEDEWYTEAVSWAAYNEIVKGVGNNRFEPHEPVTREQAVTFLFRYANMYELDSGYRRQLSDYADADSVSDWALEAMQWAVAEEIINGYGDTLEPQGLATREEIAAIFMRYTENVMHNNSGWPMDTVTLWMSATPFQITNSEGGILRYENGELQGSMHVYWEDYTTGSPAGLRVEVDPSESYLYEDTRDNGFDFSVGYGDFYASVAGAGLKRARISLADRSVEVEGEPSEYRVWLGLTQEFPDTFVIEGNSEGNFSICQTGDVIMIEGLYGEQLCQFSDIDVHDVITNEVPFTFNGKNYFDLSDLDTDGVIHFCNGEDNTVIQTVPYSKFITVPEA